MTEIIQLPVPASLTPPTRTVTILASVRRYFYDRYNSDPEFRKLLASVGNKDAVTGNRLFDRHEAVKAIRAAATAVRDPAFAGISDGIVYKYMTKVMHDHPELSLQHRREQYLALTQAAE